MITADLIPNLVESWLFRAYQAKTDLEQAAQAPGLFKPEWLQQRQADYQHALAWAHYWSGDDGLDDSSNTVTQ